MPATPIRRRPRDDLEDVDLELPKVSRKSQTTPSGLPGVGYIVHTYHDAYAKMKKQQKLDAEKEHQKKVRRKKKEAERKKAAAEEKRRQKKAAAEAKQAEKEARKAAKRKVTDLSDNNDASATATSTEPGTPASANRPSKRARQNSPLNRPRTRSIITGRSEHIPPKRSPFLLKLPLEIREIIYTYLLAPDADIPIRVCKGWTETLKVRGTRGQKRQDIHTAIMRTNKQIADECVRVLYGRNEFEYRLRDAPLPTSPPKGTNRDTDSDESDDAENSQEAGDDEESDDEYREVQIAPRRRTISSNHARRPFRRSLQGGADGGEILVIPPHEAFNPNVQINITKFGHHCRHIRIVAEPGRDTPHYRAAMSQAISTFCNLYPLRSRLHTLTIEIEPKRDREFQTISFLDFFEKDTDVIKALRGLPCQFIKFLIHTELRNPKTSRKEAEIVLDLRPAASTRRAARGDHDMWAGDEVAIKQRKLAAARTQKQMLALPVTIRKAWEAQEVELWWEYEEDDNFDADTDADLDPDDLFLWFNVQ